MVCGRQLPSAQQSSITVSGTVTDSEIGELIVGEALYVAAQDVGVTSNQFGYYSLTIQGGSVRMVVSRVSYIPQVLTYSSQEDLVLDISMVPAAENLPTILGESDVIRVIQQLPGIQSGVEGSTGLYVRGGGSDQNLIGLMEPKSIIQATCWVLGDLQLGCHQGWPCS